MTGVAVRTASSSMRSATSSTHRLDDPRGTHQSGLKRTECHDTVRDNTIRIEMHCRYSAAHSSHTVAERNLLVAAKKWHERCLAFKSLNTPAGISSTSAVFPILTRQANTHWRFAVDPSMFRNLPSNSRTNLPIHNNKRDVDNQSATEWFCVLLTICFQSRVRLTKSA